jgi:hypothetical protein
LGLAPRLALPLLFLQCGLFLVLPSALAPLFVNEELALQELGHDILRYAVRVTAVDGTLSAFSHRLCGAVTPRRRFTGGAVLSRSTRFPH